MSSEGLAIKGARLLRLYPRSWRARYETEVLGLLADRQIRSRDRLDLARGALDAHLHPDRPSLIPPLASLSGGALWTATAVVIAAQPTQLDWPGYLMDVLPLAVAGVACLTVAVVGLWLRLGDRVGPFDRLALAAAALGQAVWAVALVAALLSIGYGSATALASTFAALGEALLAVSLLRAGQLPVGGLLAAAATALVIPFTWSWLAFGLAWSAIGLIQWQARATTPSSGPRIA